MSVIIRGMKPPISCYDCPIRKRNGMEILCPVCGETFSVADVNILFYRLKNCPLSELPAQHGRLIDVDAFEADRRKHYCENCERRKGKKNGRWTFVYEIGGVACLSCGIEDALDDLEDAPTIIEAEEGEP